MRPLPSLILSFKLGRCGAQALSHSTTSDAFTLPPYFSFPKPLGEFELSLERFKDLRDERSLDHRSEETNLDQLFRVKFTIVAGNRYCNVGRIVTRQMQTIVTFVSVTDQTDADAPDPRTTDERQRAGIPGKRTRRIINADVKEGLEVVASNDARSKEDTISPVPRDGIFLWEQNGMTYIPPAEKNAHNPIFSDSLNCSPLITNIGAMRIAKSVRTQGIGPVRKRTR